MSWDHSRYLAKAQLYWGRATAHERESEEFLLNVAFMCEFLARAVLVRSSPSLNAASDSESILFSAGIEPRRPARTVDISEGLDRVSRIVTDITDSELAVAKLLIDIRNRELHSDESAMAALAKEITLPAIYAFIVKACQYMAHDPKILMGEEDGGMAIAVQEAANKDRKRRVGDLVRVQKDRFFSQNKEIQESSRAKAKAIGITAAVMKGGQHLWREKCPVCSELGLMGGPPVGRSQPILRNKEIMQEVRVIPTVFECRCCDLNIRGLDELMAAGFQHEHHTLDEIDPMELFDIDPLDHIDINEVIRENISQYEPEFMDE